MNKATLKGKLRKTRGGLMAEWGRITENDRLLFTGKMDQMLGLLQERYGYSRERGAALLTHYLGAYRKEQPTKPTLSRTGQYALASTVGLAALGTIGWFVFSKFFATTQQTVNSGQSEMATDPWAFEELEADEIEREAMGFESA